MNFAEIWPQCLLFLKDRLPPQQYQMWIAPLGVGEEGGQWLVFARNTFAFNHVRDKFWPLILDAVSARAGTEFAALLALRIGRGVQLQAAAADETGAASQSAQASAKKQPTGRKPKEAVLQNTETQNTGSQAAASGSLKTARAAAVSEPASTDEAAAHHVAERPNNSVADISGSLKTKTADKTPAGRQSPLRRTQNQQTAAALLSETAQTNTEAAAVLYAGGSDDVADNGSAGRNGASEQASETAARRARQESARDIIARRLHESASGAPSGKAPQEKRAPSRQPESGETAAKTAETAEQQEARRQQRYEETNLNPEHTFATLVQGKGNRIAHAVALSIAEMPGNDMYNPFFVYGSTGLGKTHLVQAIGNQFFQADKKARVRYIHADEFIRSIMNAFRTKSFDAMRQQYQQVDLLIMDDVQFIAGKDRTMEEFFYVYNHLIGEDKQVILTCDTLPAHIDGMDDRLKSRFSWGLTVELEPPELEMRVAILQKKAELAQVELDEDVAFFIAKHIRSNVRELEGAFKRVAAQSKFAKRRIDVGLATEALQDILAVNHKPMTLEHIQNTVAKFYGVTISDMMGKKRTRSIARPRQMAMTLAKELTNLSLPAIGDSFGGRDHTTVMHAVKSIGKLRADDAETAKAYDTLMMILRD